MINRQQYTCELAFAAVGIGKRQPNPDWLLMSISEGRNRYRQMIEEAVAAAKERRVA
ncbi:hypothetical protein GWG65_34940 [Bradyrhizobium sp. CSA207]|uniref:hypothetical protein n=1 Tax=Bradyrhizobium sp. CSA207 TaxID=2698826 RepID=UPI0023AFBF2C|nr:hypothetical protein [Bradyrhizobium sp. CSA207]MDE5446470.1 hypothetical protein [Bradyrhizobium sp. CSA207]